MKDKLRVTRTKKVGKQKELNEFFNTNFVNFFKTI